MKKILYIVNYASPDERRYKLTSFSYSAYCAAKKLNMEFHINTNAAEVVDANRDDTVKYHVVEIYRNPFSPEVIKAMKQLIDLIKKEKFDVIHCNTPVGGLLGRLAGKKCKGKKVIYQAHGFHFYKGAPLLNWLLYYPVEKWLARHTDALITINREDYALAQRKMKLRNSGKVYYVPGVGIDPGQYALQAEAREEKRAQLGLRADDVALISMGDLIKRKNYAVAIRAVAEAKNDKLHYFICGEGPEETALKTLAHQLNVADQIHFFGFRSDIKELLAAADIFLFTTKQEGLPRSMMEAMASGLPCVVSNIRGNTDLLQQGEGGFLCAPLDTAAFAEKLNLLASDAGLRKKMGNANLITVQRFTTQAVTEAIQTIYAAQLQLP